MKAIRKLKPGDPQISAADYNALVDEVVRLSKVTGEGVTVTSGAGGVHIQADPPRAAFWARLTAEYAGNPGVYLWIEQERSALGTFTDLAYGRVDDGMSPAVEANRTSGLPTDATAGEGLGAYVWLELGYGQPVTGGVIQEWIFRHGGGGGGVGGFWARIASAECASGSFGIVELTPQSVGTWIDKEGGITSSLAYHAQKGTGPFASGGPLVAVGTRVWVWRGFNGGEGAQEYVFDCPAGFTGLETVMTDWQCTGGVGTKTIMYREMWNGQQTRAMTLLPPTGPPCS